MQNPDLESDGFCVLWHEFESVLLSINPAKLNARYGFKKQ